MQPAPRPDMQSEVVRLQVLTLAWMLIECAVSLTASIRAKSVSLFAFSSDSFVEVISAAVVLAQVLPGFRLSPARAARACGTLLYALAVVVSLIALAGLLCKIESTPSTLGIAVTAGALVMMPALAWQKRRAALRLHSKALFADAVQSATCAYLAALTLAALLLRHHVDLRWIDPVAALAAVPVLIGEGRRARRGETCGCC
ncbi:cation transporter [Acidipila sp. EB88]|uniref:cation transporter n=1 Tax=Acidipila sp. EB88 TaxID=2305226 RepID=UPI000F5DAED7|nr:cation transporter [Acidipila sp. EB88]RRA49555.1 cation transporter [Acidipila sp. EB88]